MRRDRRGKRGGEETGEERRREGRRALLTEPRRRERRKRERTRRGNVSICDFLQQTEQAGLQRSVHVLCDHKQRQMCIQRHKYREFSLK